MIEHRIGDLLVQPDLTHLVHQCNIFHCFGAGIAKAIKEKFPEAYAADIATGKGDRFKLGTVSFAKTASGLTVINLYSQGGIDRVERMTKYDHMVNGFEMIRDSLQGGGHRLGIPHGIGCGLANGSWHIVNAIIEDVFEKANLYVVVCRIKG